MRRLLCSTLAIATFLAGCAGLRRDSIEFGNLADCPEQTAAELIGRQNRLGPTSDTPTLRCALNFLRNSDDPRLRRSPLASRLCLHLAERETNRTKRERLAAEGVAFAEAALAEDGADDGALHYYLAANLGLVVREHIALAMNNLKRLEREMQQALRLNPDIDHGGPLRLLGALYLKAPSWPTGIGDVDKSLSLLARAVELHPEHPLNHLFYAQALWHEDETANLDRVKAEFAQGESLLTEAEWGHNVVPWKQEFVEFAQEMGQIGSSHR